MNHSLDILFCTKEYIDAIDWTILTVRPDDDNCTAVNLNTNEVCDFNLDETKNSLDIIEQGYYTKTHDDGWTISGKIKSGSNGVFWVQYFIATHEIFGTIKGDFEEELYCSSKNTYLEFIKNHKPNIWDSYDI